MQNNLKSNLSKFFYFLKFLKPYWKQQALLLFISQIIVYLGLINPYIAKLVIDDVYGKRDFGLFLLLGAASAAIFLLIGILSGINSYYNGLIKQKIALDINKKVVSTLYSLDLKFFRDSSSSDNLYKITYDVEAAAGLITEAVMSAAGLIPTFLFTFIIVSFLNWQMAVLALLLGGLHFFNTVIFSKRRISAAWKNVSQKQEIFKRLNEVLQKIYLVKAAGKEAVEVKNHISKLSEAFLTFKQNFLLQTAGSFASQTISRSIIGIITLYGGWQIIAGNMTLGALTSIVVYLGRISGFGGGIAGLFDSINFGMLSCGRLKAIIDMAEKESAVGKKKLDHFGPNIEFRNVDFSYYDGIPVLKGFNMEITAGEWVGLSGLSGCGKTTVINLLLGLYSPDSGEVFIEDIPSQEIDFNFIKKHIGFVPQEPHLWNATIRDNLLYFNNSASLEELARAIEEVELAEVISRKQKGLDSHLGDSACKFSEGQKQRLSLARALLLRPKLLILDEALCFVDNKTAFAILEKIKLNYPDLAVLIITHNPQLLEFANKVISFK